MRVSPALRAAKCTFSAVCCPTARDLSCPVDLCAPAGGTYTGLPAVCSSRTLWHKCTRHTVGSIRRAENREAVVCVALVFLEVFPYSSYDFPLSSREALYNLLLPQRAARTWRCRSRCPSVPSHQSHPVRCRRARFSLLIANCIFSLA